MSCCLFYVPKTIWKYFFAGLSSFMAAGHVYWYTYFGGLVSLVALHVVLFWLSYLTVAVAHTCACFCFLIYNDPAE